MQVSYNQAMHELQSMFGDLDEETIRNVLAKNDGNIEPSIDELLRIQSQAENGSNNNQDFGYDDDNMFANNPRSNSNNNANQRNNYPGFEDNFGGFGGNNTGNRASNGGFGGRGGQSGSPNRDPYGLGGNNLGGDIDKDEQERIDAEMAYQLQREYMAQEQAVEQQMRNQQNNQQFVQQPGQNRAFPNGSNAAVVSAQQEKKKKKGVFSKISGGIKKIFDKKSKKGPTGLTGQYADIDDVGDNEPMYQVGSDNLNNFGNNNNNNNFGGNNNNNFGGNNFGNSNSNNFDGNLGSYSNNNNNNARNNHQQQHEEEEDAPMQLDDILNQRGLGNNNNRSNNVNANHFGY